MIFSFADVLPVKVLMSILYSISKNSNKILSSRKNLYKIITLTICKTEFTENISSKITRPDGRYQNMTNNFGEATAAFVAMPKARQIAQPKQLIT